MSSNVWTHRDVFRKTHPVGIDRGVGNFILRGEIDADSPEIIQGFGKMQKAGSVKEVVAILNEYKNLPWETIPTQFLTDEKVWKTLFYNGALGQTALLRNVTRFSKIGAFDDVVFAGDVAKALADKDKIVKGRVHPIAYANALGVYSGGRVQDYGHNRRVLEVTPNAKVLGALEAGFYNSFASIEPANKATMISLDVSASMTWDAPAGLVGMNCMEASAVMAMVSVRTEPYVVVNAFSGQMQELPISDTDTLASAKRKLSGLSFNRTDCSLPMLHAKAKGIGIDTFVIYTDNDTWSGSVKPFQALRDYRQSTGRGSRLAVVGMTATNFTIAEPSDSGMMDFVGMDSTAPKVLADFSAGRI